MGIITTAVGVLHIIFHIHCFPHRYKHGAGGSDVITAKSIFFILFHLPSRYKLVLNVGGIEGNYHWRAAGDKEYDQSPV